MNVLLCPLADPGFSYPATAVALELQQRGHTVTMMVDGPAAAAGSEVGITVQPPPDARSFGVGRWFRSGAAQYRAVRDLASAVRPDVLVTSVLCLGALLAAERLGIPVVVIGLACHLWPYAPEGPPVPDAEERRWRLAETVGWYQQAREAVGLAACSEAAAGQALHGDAFLLRGDPVLEWPGAALPGRVSHAGPCGWEPRPTPDELERLEGELASPSGGKPLVYVHLGRVFGGSSRWPWLEETFTDGRFRAVVELGRSEEHRPAPGTDLRTVRLPWCGPLMERAEVVVSSGTTSPVLGALWHDRPLLLSPNGGEQKPLTAACLRAGVADRLPSEPGDDALRAARDSPHGAARRRETGAALHRSKSAGAAADRIETVTR